jgi:NAD-dependent dihydropyrimidine dehydrogenase PreA subunit
VSDELHGIFIDLEIDESIAGDADLAAKLAEVCPVDIFSDDGGRVGLVTENLDECVLCNLCVEAAPAGTIRIVKLYE